MCVHCRVISARRSTFYLCQRSFTDQRFPRYPRLPVVRCLGHSPGQPSVGGSPTEPGDPA